MAKFENSEALAPQDTSEDFSGAIKHGNSLSGIRAQIGVLTDKFDKERFFTQETTSQTREFIGKDNEHNDEEGLKAFYEWMQEEWQKAEQSMAGLHTQIDKALTDGDAGQKDKDYLLSQLLLHNQNKDFIYNVDDLEKSLTKKLENLKEDKKRYDAVLDHPFVQGENTLSVDSTLTIKILTKQEYSAFTPKERRAFLDQVEKGLEKTEVYRKSLEKQYETTLTSSALGKASQDTFIDAFKEVSIKEQERWLKVFKTDPDAEPRYIELKDKIDTGLQGSALNQAQGQWDKLGYSDMLAEFTRISGVEMTRLDNQYEGELNKHHAKGTITRESKRSFMQDTDGMKNQTLEKKYEYLEKLPDEMKRYEDLQRDIDQLPIKQQEDIRKNPHYQEWGFTEIEKEYKDVKNGTSKDTSKSSDPIERIQSGIARSAAYEMKKNLQKTPERKNRLHKLLTLFTRKSEKAMDFQSNLRQQRQDQEVEAPKKQEREPETQSEVNVIDFQMKFREKREKQNAETSNIETRDLPPEIQNPGIESENDNPTSQVAEEREIVSKIDSLQDDQVTRKKDGLEIKKEKGLTVVSSNKEGKQKRSIELKINEREGMDNFFLEDTKRHIEEDTDNLSLAAMDSGGGHVKLKLDDVKLVKESLEMDEAA